MQKEAGYKNKDQQEQGWTRKPQAVFDRTKSSSWGGETIITKKDTGFAGFEKHQQDHESILNDKQ